jgi:hypothetical protein
MSSAVLAGAIADAFDLEAMELPVARPLDAGRE